MWLAQLFDLYVAAGNSLAGIAWCWRLRCQIVFFFMNDYTLANNRVGTIKADPIVNPIKRCLPRGVRREISEIPGVAFSVPRAAVLHARRIEMSAGRCGIRRRAIPFIMNVKSMFAGREPIHSGDHMHAFWCFIKMHCPPNIASRCRVQFRHRVAALMMCA